MFKRDFTKHGQSSRLSLGRKDTLRRLDSLLETGHSQAVDAALGATSIRFHISR